MEDAVAHKLDFTSSGPIGWGDLFVRAILCNFMINLAMLLVYAGLIKDDLGKILVMITSVLPATVIFPSERKHHKGSPKSPATKEDKA